MDGAGSSRTDGRPRILMVAARYFPFAGGIETHVHEVGRRLVEEGHSVTVLTADPTGDLPRNEVVEGIGVVRVRSWPRGRDWCLAPGIMGAVTKGRYDVVHVQGYHTFSAPFAMLAALKARLPFVLTFHSGGHSSPSRTAIRGFQQAMLGRLARRAAQLVGVSRFEADHFGRAMGIPRSRFVVVPNGASLPPPSGAALPVDPERPIVVSLGRLERYKGHHRAIDAFVELRKRLPGARLRIIGNGPYEGALRTMVEGLGLGDVVTIGGITADRRSDMTDALKAASLVVLLSDYEAHPVAVMESLSLGVRVLTATGSGFEELAEAGLVRSVAVDGPASAVAEAMFEEIGAVPNDPAALDLPTWDGCARALSEIYRRVDRTAKARRGSFPGEDFGGAVVGFGKEGRDG